MWKKLDNLHAQIYYDLKRNCDRDYYNSSLHKGGSEAVKQGALKNSSNLLLIAALCKTKEWVKLLENKIDGAKAACISTAVIHLLASIVWIHGVNSKDEVKKLKGTFRMVFEDVKTFS